MDEQIKQKIISETTSAATKTIEDTIKKSLERALSPEFPDRMTHKAAKRLKSSSIPEYKQKSTKFYFEANNEILRKYTLKLESHLSKKIFY